MLRYLSTAWRRFIELDGHNANLGHFLSDDFEQKMCHGDRGDRDRLEDEGGEMQDSKIYSDLNSWL